MAHMYKQTMETIEKCKSSSSCKILLVKNAHVQEAAPSPKQTSETDDAKIEGRVASDDP